MRLSISHRLNQAAFSTHSFSTDMLAVINEQLQLQNASSPPLRKSSASLTTGVKIPSTTSPAPLRTSIKSHASKSLESNFAWTPSAGQHTPNDRDPFAKPISPELPLNDALYLFVNFQSFMHSPEEGHEGIKVPDDFVDSVKLLKFARARAAIPGSNVNILHVKYGFKGVTQAVEAPWLTDNQRKQLLPESLKTKRLKQPLPTQQDPVLRINYNEDTGEFKPLPAYGVFTHIGKKCVPPPRVIVLSYVGATVMDSHIASITSWAIRSSPPIAVIAPEETRVRSQRAECYLRDRLRVISMYAPTQEPTRTSSLPDNAPPPSPRTLMTRRSSEPVLHV